MGPGRRALGTAWRAGREREGCRREGGGDRASRRGRRIEKEREKNSERKQGEQDRKGRKIRAEGQGTGGERGGRGGKGGGGAEGVWTQTGVGTVKGTEKGVGEAKETGGKVRGITWPETWRGEVTERGERERSERKWGGGGRRRGGEGEPSQRDQNEGVEKPHYQRRQRRGQGWRAGK